MIPGFLNGFRLSMVEGICLIESPGCPILSERHDTFF